MSQLLQPDLGITAEEMKDLPKPARMAAEVYVNWMEMIAARPLGWKQAVPFTMTPPFTNMLIQSGRGWGKTKVAIHWAAKALALPDDGQPINLGIICPTQKDGRRFLERNDGLLSCLPPAPYTKHNRAHLKGTLWNGSSYEVFSSQNPQYLRGPDIDKAVMDEASSFMYPEILGNVLACLRRGRCPQMLVTTTLKRNEITRELLKLIPEEFRIRGETKENIALSPEWYKRLRDFYGDSLLGEQELGGAFIEEVPGALFKSDNIDKYRVNSEDAKELRHVAFAVGVDPQGAHRNQRELSDKDDSADLGMNQSETGIVIASKATNGHIYIHEDLSASMPADIWAAAVVHAAEQHKPSVISVERNFGGDMVKASMQRFNKNQIPIIERQASDSKIVRAQPLSILYQQGVVHHIGQFPKLEMEMTSHTAEAKRSPNRLDALVWAVEALMGERRRIITPQL